jgi:hypothetical protein
MFPVVHESLLWGLPLLGVPILIHLINMMRHRRVKWAAMEFLLVSQKRHRTWIILKQLLLMLLRIAAIAAVVLMLAQPRQQWTALLGETKTHHIVLLDDSFSMADRWANTSAFDQAKEVVLRLADQAARQDNAQAFTILRFSQAGTGGRSTQPDMLEEPLTVGFKDRLAKLLDAVHVSQTAAGPDEALEAIDRLANKRDFEDRVLYVVSDFRANQWDDPQLVRTALTRLQTAGTQLQLVNCVDAAHPNLAIVGLTTGAGARAAGVPLSMEVSVANYGSTPARSVSVLLEEDGSTRPAVVIEKIAPGKVVTRRFPVVFGAGGEHQVAARLEADAVAADDVRYAVVAVAPAVPVLIVDGDPRALDAFFLGSALAPGGKVKSGLSPIVESPRFLRDHPLENYETIFLLNFDRLDEAEIEPLEAYVRAGGGLGIFLGELSQADFINKHLYRDGAGLFPLPLAGPTELLVDRLDKAPDLEVTDHPIFSVFAGERNSFINTVLVERYFAAQKNWTPPVDSATQVIARLRNGAPLAVEHRFGEGRVVAVLTKAGPGETPQGSWNNWGRNNPSYVVAMLEMQAYLAEPRHADRLRLVGNPLTVEMPLAEFQPQVRFVLPPDQGGGTLSVDADAGSSELTAVLADTWTSGVYEAQLTERNTGKLDARRFAVNVDPAEGRLERLDGPQLADRLQGITYRYQQAKDLVYDADRLAGPNLGKYFMLLLVVILLSEQVLSYSTSYHPATRGGTR